MDELLRLKEQGDGSILKAISDSVIKRWEHDFMPDYMRSRDIQTAFKEMNSKTSQNHIIAELATKNIEKL
jgi:ribosomal protein S17E